jgi:hypothetical protein
VATVAVMVAVATSACGPSPSPIRRESPDHCEQGDKLQERHGTDCGCCHTTQFSVSGSLSRNTQVVKVVVEAADGMTLELAPNPHFNFFRHTDLQFPLRVWTVDTKGAVSAMQAPVQQGSCNACHGAADGAVPQVGTPR